MTNGSIYELDRPAKPHFGYAARPSAFILSMAVHGALIAALSFTSTVMRERKAEEAPVRLKDYKIIYYNFKPKLPDVEPAETLRTSPEPTGKILSRRTMVVDSPKPQSTQQMIWQPAPKVEIKQDLQVPDAIARIGQSANALPAPPPPAPPAPPPEVRMPDPPKAPRKVFVASAPVPRKAEAVAVLDAPSPTAGAAPIGDSPKAISGLAPSALAGPPAPSPGNASVDFAVANRQAVDRPSGEVPDGSRAGQFSKAPSLGEGSAPPGGGGLTVPNLSVREPDKKDRDAAPAEAAPRRAIVYAERVGTSLASSFSVPLRPSTRTIPRAIEARFTGRNVYTMVVPIENLPAYSGDWIMWFAERTPVPGESPLVKAPVLVRKLERADFVPGPGAGKRVLLAASIGINGKAAAIVALNVHDPSVAQGVVDDLASWEFKPATRNGQPTPVDLVIEMSIRLP